MIDKAFAIQQAAREALLNPQTAFMAHRVLDAQTDDERSTALAEFSMELSALVVYLTCNAVMSEADREVLSQTITELNEMSGNGEDN